MLNRITRPLAVIASVAALTAGIGATSSAVAATSLSKAKATATNEINAKIALYDNVTYTMTKRDLGAEYGRTSFLPGPAPLGKADDVLFVSAAKDRATLKGLLTTVAKASSTKTVSAAQGTARAYTPGNYLTAQSLLITHVTDTRDLTKQVAIFRDHIAVLTVRVQQDPEAQSVLWAAEGQIEDSLAPSLAGVAARQKVAQSITGRTSATTLKQVKFVSMHVDRESVMENLWVSREHTATLARDGWLTVNE